MQTWFIITIIIIILVAICAAVGAYFLVANNSNSSSNTHSHSVSKSESKIPSKSKSESKIPSKSKSESKAPSQSVSSSLITLIPDIDDAILLLSLRQGTAGNSQNPIAVQNEDGDITNVDFTSDGTLDTDTITSLGNGTSDVFIRHWFNQMDHDFYMSVSDGETMPLIYTNGALVMAGTNDKIAGKYNTNETLMQNKIANSLSSVSNFSVYVVCDSTSITDEQSAFSGSDSSTSQEFGIGTEDDYIYAKLNDNYLKSKTATAGYGLIEFYVDGNSSSQTLYVNNTLITRGFVSFSTATFDTITIFPTSSIQEVIMFPSNMESNRTNIVENIIDYYGIST